MLSQCESELRGRLEARCTRPAGHGRVCTDGRWSWDDQIITTITSREFDFILWEDQWTKG